MGCRIGGSNRGVPDRWVKSWGAGLVGQILGCRVSWVKSWVPGRSNSGVLGEWIDYQGEERKIILNI